MYHSECQQLNKTGGGNRQLSITSKWKTKLLPNLVELNYLSPLGRLSAASSISTCSGKINDIPQSCPRFPSAGSTGGTALLQTLLRSLMGSHGGKGHSWPFFPPPPSLLRAVNHEQCQGSTFVTSCPVPALAGLCLLGTSSRGDVIQAVNSVPTATGAAVTSSPRGSDHNRLTAFQHRVVH